MVGILAQVDDIFSWAPRGGKLLGTRWGMRIQGHGYLNILCRCNIRRSAADQREHGFLLDQHYGPDQAWPALRLNSQKGGLKFDHFPIGRFGSEKCSWQPLIRAARIRGRNQKAQARSPRTRELKKKSLTLRAEKRSV